MFELFDDLERINREIESNFGISLSDDDFSYGLEEIIHIYLHEACHAAVSNLLPWIHDLDPKEHTALDEILARLLEESVGSSLDLPIHTVEEQVQELNRYPVNITIDQYRNLQEKWNKDYWPDKDLEGMANFSLRVFRHEGVTG